MKTIFVLLIVAPVAFAQDVAPLLTRVEAVRMAKEGNLALRGAVLQKDASDASRDAARGALLPSLSLASNLARTGPNFAGDPRSAGAVSAQPDMQWTNAFQLTWSFLNPASWGGWRAASATAEAASIHAGGQLVQLASTVDLAYHDVVRQQALLSAVSDELALSRARRDIARAHRAIGVSSALELMQAQLSVDADSAALLAQESSRDVARSGLNALLGRDPRTPFRVEDTIPVVDPGAFERILSDARASASGVAEMGAKSRALEAQASAADLNVMVPVVSAFASYGFANRWHDQNPPPDVAVQGFAYGMQASWALFTGGSQAAQARALRAQARAAELVRADSALQLERNVAQGWDSWVRARAALELGDRGTSLADSTLALASAQYRIGAISGIDFRQAQEIALQARTRAVTARWSARAAALQLFVLAGRETN